ncbi:MAG: hypothetical protein M3037_07325, partial [Gemmatimonadota bacterium]|nr:hypothetical protein [Gemmatimonadota bacterium]
MEQEEHVGPAISVFRVQGADAGRRRGKDPFVIRPVLRRSIREVAEYCELEVWVAVGEVLNFDVFERLF